MVSERQTQHSTRQTGARDNGSRRVLVACVSDLSSPLFLSSLFSYLFPLALSAPPAKKKKKVEEPKKKSKDADKKKKPAKKSSKKAASSSDDSGDDDDLGSDAAAEGSDADAGGEHNNNHTRAGQAGNGSAGARITRARVVRFSSLLCAPCLHLCRGRHFSHHHQQSPRQQEASEL